MKKHSGALLTANFGQRPFVFDINDKMYAEKARVSNESYEQRPPHCDRRREESSFIQELVAQFLAHDGYVETAKAFAEEIRAEKQSLNNALPTAAPASPRKG